MFYWVIGKIMISCELKLDSVFGQICMCSIMQITASEVTYLTPEALKEGPHTDDFVMKPLQLNSCVKVK